MSSPAPLSALADPMALARLQVLLVPVHRDSAEPLLEPVFVHWSMLFRKHQTLRGDEIVHGSQASPAHRRGAPESPRSRFLPSAPGTSISRAAGASTVQLAFPAQPPAKHLYALSLLRMSTFPLVVIGIGVDDAVEGYSVGSETPTPDKAAAAQAWTQTFTQTLAGIMPPTSAFPLVKRLVLVPSQLPVSDPRSPARGAPRTSAVGTPRSSIAASAAPNLGFIRYAPAEGGDSWAAKLLGEVIGDVYGELGELVSRTSVPTDTRLRPSSRRPA